MSLAKTQNCPLRAKMLQIEQYPVPYRNRTSAHHREEPHFFHERFQQNMEKAATFPVSMAMRIFRATVSSSCP